jgi:hypothetical protein
MVSILILENSNECIYFWHSTAWFKGGQGRYSRTPAKLTATLADDIVKQGWHRKAIGSRFIDHCFRKYFLSCDDDIQVNIISLSGFDLWLLVSSVALLYAIRLKRSGRLAVMRGGSN